MKTCETCKANKVCDHNRFGFENCGNYISKDVVPRAEVIEEYRKKVYAKMEKYTVFGREYIQRIMRECEKEYTEENK